MSFRGHTLSMKGKTRSPDTRPGDDGRGIASKKVGRRAFLGTVGAGAAVAMGAGSVAAQVEGYNFASDFAHESVLSGTTTISSVGSNMSELEYEDDSGTVRDLSQTHGLRLAPRPETEDGTVVAHNPVSYPLRAVESDEYTAFPRETYETDTDGNEDTDLPVSWTDSSYWTNTGTSMTLTESAGDSILFSATDDVSTFAQEEWSITDDERRHYLLVVLDVVSLDSGATVTIRASDSTGTAPPAEARVDDAGDPEAEDVIATTVGDGYAYQIPLGDLEAGVENIDQVEVDITGTAEVRIHGLNLDRTSGLTFGTSEEIVTDDDGNESVETSEIMSHNSGGPLSITSLSTVDSTLKAATLRDVSIEIEQRARDLPPELVEVEVSDTPSGYDKEDRVTLGATHTLPAAYDLAHEVAEVVLRGALPSSRYFSVGYSSPSTEPDTITEYQDLTLTSVSDQLDPSADDPETQLVSSLVATDGIDVVIDIMTEASETKDLTSAGPSGGFALSSSSGGSGPLSGIKGVILMIATLVGGVVAWGRGKLS